ncbi:MAG TPA: hypothetical protein VMT18_14710 [Planctomycetota bacterium]|nr:hypothetical protein [Planctomycetota bacterium]
MAAGISNAGQVQEVLVIARRRVWGVFLPAVLTGSLGVMAGSLLPAKYTAETRMELGVVPKPLVDAGLDQGRLRDEMRAAEYNLSTFSRMDEILSGLEWEHYDVLPPDERREFVRLLLKDMWVLVESLEGTNVVFMKFGYRDTDPQRAAQFANYIRDYFVEDLIEDVTTKARSELERLTADYRVADDDYEEASARLQDLKGQHGISPTWNPSGEGREAERDPMYVALQERLADLTRTEQELEATQVRLEQLRLRRESLPATIDESATEFGGLDLGEAIAELNEVISDARIRQQGKKPAHSEYQRAQRVIVESEGQIAALEGRTVDPKRVVSSKPNPELAVLDKEIAELELKILESQAGLAAIERSIQDLEPKVLNRSQVYANLKRQWDMLELIKMRRTGYYAQTELQRQLVNGLTLPDFTPFDVNQGALPPVKPSSPSALIIVAVGLVLGLGIGVMYALVAEFGRNGYRGPNDLARGLPAPVLGAINEIVTANDRRQRAFRSGLVGAATLILSASVLWITWAFHSRPNLLGPELTGWLDQMRGTLR